MPILIRSGGLADEGPDEVRKWCARQATKGEELALRAVLSAHYAVMMAPDASMGSLSMLAALCSPGICHLPVVLRTSLLTLSFCCQRSFHHELVPCLISWLSASQYPVSTCSSSPSEHGQAAHQHAPPLHGAQLLMRLA